MGSRGRWRISGFYLLCMGLYMQQAGAQGVEVSGKILIRQASEASGKKHKASSDAENVVIWLSPTKPGSVPPFTPVRQTSYRLVQKNKMFTPHLLVVPTGSSVQFPNEDPFFHNVFSLFNGKRFDLGLYESGTSRSVRFDREGVSYIFCNIHPEMGAVILALSTPLYGVSGPDGVVSVHNVPPGSYRLNIWSENAQTTNQPVEERIVQVSAEPVHLGEITLQTTTGVLANHKNKFGEEYPPVRDPGYQK